MKSLAKPDALARPDLAEGYPISGSPDLYVLKQKLEFLAGQPVSYRPKAHDHDVLQHQRYLVTIDFMVAS